MKTSIFLIIIFLLAGCKTSKEVNRKSDKEVIKEMTMDKKAILGDINMLSDSIQINKAIIIGNTLSLEVSYSGGCRNHDFTLVGNPMIAKSLPPIRSVILVHNANQDECKKQIIETLNFDIRDFAFTQGEGEIYLKIKGFENKVLYHFIP